MDDDDKEPEDAAAEPARPAAQEADAKLREVSEEELKRILAAHETWVETGEEKGKQADLSQTDLQKAHLYEAKLQGADLFNANLQRAKLQGADLQGADFSRANLTEVKHLTRRQLDFACGDDKTTLPDYLADYQMKPCTKPEQSSSN